MQTDPKGKLAEVTRFAAARILAPGFRGVPEDEQHAAAERFLDEEEIDSGIPVSRGDTLRFWHLTFQEYLAAAALASRDANRPRLLFDEKKLYLPEWRETVLLLAGILCTQGQERIDAFLAGILDGLGNDAPLATRARAVGLIGRILQDLQSWNYRIDSSGSPSGGRNLPEVMPWTRLFRLEMFSGVRGPVLFLAFWRLAFICASVAMWWVLSIQLWGRRFGEYGYKGCKWLDVATWEAAAGWEPAPLNRNCDLC